MSDPKTYADEIRGISSRVLWGSTFLGIALVVFGLDPLETMKGLLADQGIGVDEAQLMGFVAGLTLPLTVAAGIIAFMVLVTNLNMIDSKKFVIVTTGVLYVTSFIADDSKLGLPLRGGRTVNAGFLTPLLSLLSMYLSSYGLPLMLASVTLGIVSAIQVERLVHSMHDRT